MDSDRGERKTPRPWNTAEGLEAPVKRDKREELKQTKLGENKVLGGAVSGKKIALSQGRRSSYSATQNSLPF